MAYPTGLLSITLDAIDRRIVRMKSQVQTLRDATAAGPVGGSRILDLWGFLKTERPGLVSAAATPGLAEYAREQKNKTVSDPTFDVVAEFNALIAAIDNVTGWMEANFPKDAGGFILAQTFGASGLVDRQFTSAQTAGLRTQLDALLNAIV